MTFPAAKQLHDMHGVFLKDAVDLLLLRRGGHTGRWAYTDVNWTEFSENNPFYHVYNEECGLFALYAHTLAALCGHLKTATDIGMGTRSCFVRKILPVLARHKGLDELIGIDICEGFSRQSAADAGRWIPSAKLRQIQADFYASFPALEQSTVAFFTGSTISNIVLLPGETLHDGLVRAFTYFASSLPPGSQFLFSYDSCHDPLQLARAYRHPALEAMEVSIIDRMADELGMKGMTSNDFDAVDTWYPERHLWAKELQAKHDLSFIIDGITGHLNAGQKLWSASCYKYTDAMMEDAIKESPFEHVWQAKAENMRLVMVETDESLSALSSNDSGYVSSDEYKSMRILA